jgi:hypothetical protein
MQVARGPGPAGTQRAHSLHHTTNVRCIRSNVNPGMMQDIIMGSVVTAAVCSTVFNGLKKGQVEICDLCKGIGTAHHHSFC